MVKYKGPDDSYMSWCVHTFIYNSRKDIFIIVIHFTQKQNINWFFFFGLEIIYCYTIQKCYSYRQQISFFFGDKFALVSYLSFLLYISYNQMSSS